MHPKFVEINKHTKVLNLLSYNAYVGNQEGFKVAAALVNRRELLTAIGQCQRKTHPLQLLYAPRPEAIFLHAETDAIRHALNFFTLEQIENSILYVARIKYTDRHKKFMEFGNAKPCIGCQRAIVTFGIKELVYTNDGFTYTELSTI